MPACTLRILMSGNANLVFHHAAFRRDGEDGFAISGRVASESPRPASGRASGLTYARLQCAAQYGSSLHRPRPAKEKTRVPGSPTGHLHVSAVRSSSVRRCAHAESPDPSRSAPAPAAARTWCRRPCAGAPAASACRTPHGDRSRGRATAGRAVSPRRSPRRSIISPPNFWAISFAGWPRSHSRSASRCPPRSNGSCRSRAEPLAMCLADHGAAPAVLRVLEAAERARDLARRGAARPHRLQPLQALVRPEPFRVLPCPGPHAVRAARPLVPELGVHRARGAIEMPRDRFRGRAELAHAARLDQFAGHPGAAGPAAPLPDQPLLRRACRRNAARGRSAAARPGGSCPGGSRAPCGLCVADSRDGASCPPLPCRNGAAAPALLMAGGAPRPDVH